eukprot:gene19522-biopygen17602
MAGFSYRPGISHGGTSGQRPASARAALIASAAFTTSSFILSISDYGFSTCAVRDDGGVECWGLATSKQHFVGRCARRGPCTNGVLNGTAVRGVNYEVCNKLRDGEECGVIYDACPLGQSAPSNASKLRMDCHVGDSPFPFRYDGSRVGSCEENTCDQPLALMGGASYEQCSGKRTGQTCSPTCAAGYYPNATINLTCTGVRLRGRIMNVYDVQGAGCAPYNCSHGPNTSTLHSSLRKAGFTDCNASSSGTVCLPQCPAEFTIKPREGKQLICSSDGQYSMSG